MDGDWRSQYPLAHFRRLAPALLARPRWGSTNFGAWKASPPRLAMDSTWPEIPRTERLAIRKPERARAASADETAVAAQMCEPLSVVAQLLGKPREHDSHRPLDPAATYSAGPLLPPPPPAEVSPSGLQTQMEAWFSSAQSDLATGRPSEFGSWASGSRSVVGPILGWEKSRSQLVWTAPHPWAAASRSIS